MIKYVTFNCWQTICNKCGRYLPTTTFYELRNQIRKYGWYKIDIAPTNTIWKSFDVCDICAKNYTLKQLT